MTSLSFKFPSVLQISMSVPASLMEDAFTIVSTSLETTDARATMASVWPTMDTTAWVSYRFFHSHTFGPKLLKRSTSTDVQTKPFASGSVSVCATTANLRPLRTLSHTKQTNRSLWVLPSLLELNS